MLTSTLLPPPLLGSPGCIQGGEEGALTGHFQPPSIAIYNLERPEKEGAVFTTHQGWEIEALFIFPPPPPPPFRKAVGIPSRYNKRFHFAKEEEEIGGGAKIACLPPPLSGGGGGGGEEGAAPGFPIYFPSSSEKKYRWKDCGRRRWGEKKEIVPRHRRRLREICRDVRSFPFPTKKREETEIQFVGLNLRWRWRRKKRVWQEEGTFNIYIFFFSVPLSYWRKQEQTLFNDLRH